MLNSTNDIFVAERDVVRSNTDCTYVFSLHSKVFPQRNNEQLALEVLEIDLCRPKCTFSFFPLQCVAKYILCMLYKFMCIKAYNRACSLSCIIASSLMAGSNGYIGVIIMALHMTDRSTETIKGAHTIHS